MHTKIQFQTLYMSAKYGLLRFLSCEKLCKYKRERLTFFCLFFDVKLDRHPTCKNYQFSSYITFVNIHLRLKMESTFYFFYKSKNTINNWYRTVFILAPNRSHYINLLLCKWYLFFACTCSNLCGISIIVSHLCIHLIK